MVSDIESIKLALEAGGVVVTVNARLALYLKKEYGLSMEAGGRECWETPEIFKLDGWLEHLFKEGAETAILLKEHCSRALWEEIIKADKGILDAKLLFREGVTSDSYRAYELMKEYCLSLSGPEIYLTVEAAALKRWVLAYEEALEGLDSIDVPSLPQEVDALLRKGRVSTPPALVFAGFDRVTPSIASLVRTLTENGIEVSYWPGEPVLKAERSMLDGFRGRVEIFKASDDCKEVEQAARFARAGAARGERVGIIVTDLPSYRELISSEFRSELEPASVLPEKLLHVPRAYNAALNIKLSEHALVKSALDILSVDRAPVETERLFKVLSSPYLLDPVDEGVELSRIDARLRRENSFDIRLSYLIERLVRDSSPVLEGLRARLSKWMNILKGAEATGRKVPSAWSKHFSELLDSLGWSIEKAKLESAEHQALKKWEALLSKFATLDDILGSIGRREAVWKLNRMADDEKHQAEGADSLIQIMSDSEAVGQRFDSLWVMGAHDASLPREPSPNPFIPIELQKRCALRNSSYEVELDFSIRTLSRLLASAPVVVASYPAFSGDKEMRPSQLVAPLSGGDFEGAGQDGSRFKDSLRSSPGLEDMPAEGLLPVAVDEGIKGGTTLLKDFSACPFKAFSAHRLKAVEIAVPEPGLTSMEGGSIVHKALEFFWKDVENSIVLLELKETGRLKEAVSGAVSAALKEWRERYPLRKHHLNLEARRVEALLLGWLEVELKRSGFVVSSIEGEEKVSLCGSDFEVRIDRIDKLPGGEKVIIDYKGSVLGANRWLPPRPIEPQLPVYTLTGDYDAVAFASLKPGELRFKGVARSEGLLPGVKPFEKNDIRRKLRGVADYDGLVSEWKESVVGLAEAYLSGSVSVDPASRNGNDQPCERCDFHTLCRVFELKGPRAAWLEEDAGWEDGD